MHARVMEALQGFEPLQQLLGLTPFRAAIGYFIAVGFAAATPSALPLSAVAGRVVSLAFRTSLLLPTRRLGRGVEQG